ncbi:AfsR/SARP family transcriptional regulator [Salinactinospora qingdaonensis]|uniref:BTAD domain-containing putative transcriptional regulator n=1 Tax=Salinactinospora qingdaonensis TaxID=702744 RepID=A0ABP7FCY7_9ACTN
MEINVLGAVELRVGHRAADIGKGKELALLAVLALSAGRPVSMDVLAERLWDGAPSEKSRATLYSYANRLRRSLERAGLSRDLIVQRSGAYVLHVEEDTVDWHRFRRLCDEAATVARDDDPERAMALLDGALKLWRGEPLADVAGRWARDMRPTMEQAYQSAIGQWAETALRAGRADEIVARLTEFVSHYPFNERLTLALMLALRQAGRPTEAVTTYLELQRLLAEEAGIDPGPETQRIYQELLGGPSALTTPAPSPDEQRVLRRRHDNLGRDIADFTDRQQELADVLTAIHPTQGVASQATGVCVISGMAGVGKTSLALHAAHLIKSEFPDVRLSLDLRSHNERLEPLGEMEALYELLRMLDLPPRQIPSSVEQRAALWRDQTAELRALIVLDDAVDHRQVHSLIPGGSECAVLITSRRRLPEIDGAHHVELTVPSSQHAMELFATISGASVDDPDGELEAIVRMCEYLPLAMRIGALQLRHHPTWTATELLGWLESVLQRVSEFRAGDRSLEAVLRLSVRGVSSSASAAFARLGLHPAAAFDRYAAAALMGRATGEAQPILEELLDYHLIEEYAPHRYRMHALVAAFAQRHAEHELAEPQRRSVLHRLLNFYLAACDAADRTLSPHRLRSTPETSPGIELPVFPGRKEAVEWLRTEETSLLAIFHYADRYGFTRQAASFSHVIADYAEEHGPWEAAAGMHRRALRIWRDLGEETHVTHSMYELSRVELRMGEVNAALETARAAVQRCRERGDQLREAQVVDHLGLIHYVVGRYEAAQRCHNDALAVYRRFAHQAGVAESLGRLANCHQAQCHYHAAVEHFTESARIYGSLGETYRQAKINTNLAGAHKTFGYHREAQALCEEALPLFRALGDLGQQGLILNNIGEIAAYKGDPERALRHYQEALALQQQTHDRWSEVVTRCNVGRAYLMLGEPEQALPYLEESRRLSATFGSPSTRVELFLAFGDLQLALRRSEDAVAYYHEAHRIAHDAGIDYEEALALERLGRVALSRDQATIARDCFERAHQIFARLGVPEAASVGFLMESFAETDF